MQMEGGIYVNRQKNQLTVVIKCEQFLNSLRIWQKLRPYE